MRFVEAYHRPRSLEEAICLKGECPEARFIAGGTDIMPRMRAGTERPRVLISLRNVEELRGIEVGEEIRIGAATTVSEILAHPDLAEACPVLVDAARPFACVQVRNVATVGGNLCNASPAADLAPPLLVLQVTASIQGPGGLRKVPLEELFLGPGRTCLAGEDVLVSVEFPRPGRRTGSSYRRMGRVGMDIALAGVAVFLEMNKRECRTARVAAGAVAPRPLRLEGAESILSGAVLDRDRIERAALFASREVSPITDVRAGGDYRGRLAGILLKRAVEDAVGGLRDGC